MTIEQYKKAAAGAVAAMQVAQTGYSGNDIATLAGLGLIADAITEGLAGKAGKAVSDDRQGNKSDEDDHGRP